MPGSVYSAVYWSQERVKRTSNENIRFLERIEKCEEVSANAIRAIEAGALDEQVKTDLITILGFLEAAIALEAGERFINIGQRTPPGDKERMVTKHEALAAMLQTIVLDQNTFEVKAAALETYLNAFNVASSQIEERVKLGLQIAFFVVLFATMIALSFVVPMIPFTALLVAGGATAAAAAAGGTALGMVTSFCSILFTSVLLSLFVSKIYEPLCRLVQQHTDEFKLSRSLGARLAMGFFTEPQLLSQDNQPLLQTQGNDSEDDRAGVGFNLDDQEVDGVFASSGRDSPSLT